MSLIGKQGNAKLVDTPRKEAYNKWMLTITLWPQICTLSGRRIPMYSKAYVWKDGVVERWVIAEEFIIARLKGEI
jgi:hypothetical protein